MNGVKNIVYPNRVGKTPEFNCFLVLESLEDFGGKIQALLCYRRASNLLSGEKLASGRWLEKKAVLLIL